MCTSSVAGHSPSLAHLDAPEQHQPRPLLIFAFWGLRPGLILKALQQRSSNIFSEDLIDQPEKSGQFCSMTSHQLPQIDAYVYWACLYISVSQAFISTTLINIFKQLY